MRDPTKACASQRRSYHARTWGWIGVRALRILTATWREHHEGLHLLDELLENKRPHIMTFWHRKFVTLFPLLQGRPVCVATAASPPGDIIADMCDRFGYLSVQIPDHGRDHSLNLMGKAFAHADQASMAVDGPHGPYHAVKQGAIQLASDLGHLIVPVSVATRRNIVLSHRWDQLEIPVAFTRVSLVIGDPINIPPNLSQDKLPIWTKRLHDVLEELDERAERKVRGL